MPPQWAVRPHGPLGPLPTGRDEGPTSEPDEALVDECCLLPSQLLIPSLDWLPVSDGLVSRLQPKQPLRLHFGKAPPLPAGAGALPLDGLVRCVPTLPRGPYLRRAGHCPLASTWTLAPGIPLPPSPPCTQSSGGHHCASALLPPPRPPRGASRRCP